MNGQTLQVFPFGEDILLVIYPHQGRKKPSFVLRDNFQPELFVPPPESERTAVIELTLDTDVWQSFQSSCAAFNVTLEDCLHAWLYFLTKLDSSEAEKVILGIEDDA